MNFDIELITGVSAVALVVALCQIVKYMGFPKKFIPLFALVLGIGMSVGYSMFKSNPMFTAIVGGLAIGVSAIGSFSASKNLMEAFFKD